jgi:type VI secretion system secreted protein VgrG
MSDPIFSVESDALPSGTTLVGFKGQEGISILYRFEIFVTVPGADGADDLDEAIGAPLTLTIDRGGDAAPYAVHGVVAEVSVLYEPGDNALARLVLVPRLSLLDLGRHSRIFTGKKAPEIIEDILQKNGLSGGDYELRLSGSYATEEHVCQYKESDFAFVSRWMEREGMYWFFEHEDGVDKLVITDDRARHQAADRGAVLFRPSLGRDVSARDALRTFRAKKLSRPGSVKLRDYDYAKPSFAVSGSENVWKGGDAEVTLHGERLFTPGDAKRLAKIRAEELTARQSVYSGEGMAFGLRVGSTFELSEHLVDKLNKSYLVIELAHSANLSAKSGMMRRLTGLENDLVYEVRVLAIDAEAQYRAPRLTPWPRIEGFEGAVVDGPESHDYSQVDSDGRYHVKLHFDEGDLKDGKGSTAVRMMQPHGGNPEGFHFPLRKGTEVMIAFWGGDPDRPFIAGAVPNAENPSPVTAKNHTRNIIHTGGDTHIEAEDEKGKQWVDIRTPPKDTFIHLGEPHDADSHYIVENTKGDCLFEIGSNQDINVGGELHETVDGAVKEEYKATHTTDIKGPQTTTVTAGGVTEIYQNLHLTVVTSAVTEEYKSGQKSTVSGGLRFEVFCSGQKTTVSGGLAQQQWTGAHKRDVDGATSNTHLGTLSVHGMSTVSETFDSTVTQLFGPVTAKYASLQWQIPDGAAVTCSNFDVLIPFDNWAFLNNTYTKVLKLQIAALLLSTYVLKLSRVGLALGANGAKADASGISIGIVGLDLKIDKVELESKAIYWKPKAFYLCT